MCCLHVIDGTDKISDIADYIVSTMLQQWNSMSMIATVEHYKFHTLTADLLLNDFILIPKSGKNDAKYRQEVRMECK